MRFVIKADEKITERKLQNLLSKFSDFCQQNIGRVPDFYIEWTDFTSVPTEPDRDGDLKPTNAYLKGITKDVYERYTNWGTDHVVLLVHEDNWIFRGIWGTNWSNKYYSYQVHLSRFDDRNPANSFGTLYHEMMHSLDALIKTTIGFDVNSLELAPSWDKYCVHGGRPDRVGTTKWEYIRYQENVSALRKIAPYLRKSYTRRKALHDKQINLMEKVIVLLEKLLVLRRRNLNIKDGVKKP